MSASIIAVVNQKGGVGKTFSCINIGIGLVNQGKKVLLIDFDPQASLTIGLGYPQPDQLPVTITDLLEKVIEDELIETGEGILHHTEGIDLIPADIRLSGMEMSLVHIICRESILKQYLQRVKHLYTHIFIDCQPSLGMLTINALTAADRVLIPVQAEYLPVKGLEQLLHSIAKVRKQLNPDLLIDGILITMADRRTVFTREISKLLRECYGKNLHIFPVEIPHSVRAKESNAEGKSIFKYMDESKVADAYGKVVKEVLNLEKQREKYPACQR